MRKNWRVTYEDLEKQKIIKRYHEEWIIMQVDQIVSNNLIPAGVKVAEIRELIKDWRAKTDEE